MKVLGLDVGGVNIKYAQALSGTIGLPKLKLNPFEIYKRPGELANELKAIKDKTNPDMVALTMTGELADVFKTRREGVRHIISSVVKVFADIDVKALDVNGDLVLPSKAIKSHASVASANWAATARWTALHMANCVIVDIGSTTTDILSVANGEMAVNGKTDLDRLKTQELLYTGYLRTNCASILPLVKIGKVMAPACPEYFSIVGDAHLYLGRITARRYCFPTPDGGPKTKPGAGRRLARLVLTEPQTIGEHGVRSIARQVINAQAGKIADAINKVVTDKGLENAPVVLLNAGPLYSGMLKKMAHNKFATMVGGCKAENMDPASCLARLGALWPEY